MNSPSFFHSTPGVALALALLLLPAPARGQEFPVGDAFGKGHVEPDPAISFPARNDNPGPVHRSLKAGVTDSINDPVPVPEALLRSSGKAPWYYNDLLRQAPSNQVQSRIYNPEGFKKARRICLIEFDNKTIGPGRDERAARVVTHQIQNQLRNLKRYTVTVEPGGASDAHMKIVSPRPGPPESGEPAAAPGARDEKPASAAAGGTQALQSPACQDGPVDAIMVGAVTRFLNTYTDRHGKTREALSPSVEFGVYLVRKTPGVALGDIKELNPKDVLWGARYVGSQATGLPAIARGQLGWYSKEELSRSAMKNVLKEFDRER